MVNYDLKLIVWSTQRFQTHSLMFAPPPPTGPPDENSEVLTGVFVTYLFRGGSFVNKQYIFVSTKSLLIF